MERVFQQGIEVFPGAKLLDLCVDFLEMYQKNLPLPPEKKKAVALNLALSAYRLGTKGSQQTVSCSTSDWTNCTRARFAASAPVLMKAGDTLRFEAALDNGAVAFTAVVVPKSAPYVPTITVGEIYRLGEDQIRVTALTYDKTLGWMVDVEAIDGRDLQFDAVAAEDLKPL